MTTLVYLLLILKAMAGGYQPSVDDLAYPLILFPVLDAGTVFMTLTGMKFLRKES